MNIKCYYLAFQIVPLHILKEDEEFLSYMIESNERYVELAFTFDISMKHEYNTVTWTAWKTNNIFVLYSLICFRIGRQQFNALKKLRGYVQDM